MKFQTSINNDTKELLKLSTKVLKSASESAQSHRLARKHLNGAWIHYSRADPHRRLGTQNINYETAISVPNNGIALSEVSEQREQKKEPATKLSTAAGLYRNAPPSVNGLYGGASF